MIMIDQCISQADYVAFGKLSAFVDNSLLDPLTAVLVHFYYQFQNTNNIVKAYNIYIFV